MRNILKGLLIGVVFSGLVFWPMASFAFDRNKDAQDHGKVQDHGQDHRQDRGHDRDRRHDRDRSYVGFNFSIWPGSYNYSAPYYPSTQGVFVSPPVYQPVVINGITYYFNNGNYYVYNGYEYQAVAPPTTVIVNQVQSAPVVMAAAPVVNDSEDSFTINIPNDNGGYTGVTLRKSGNGYLGPQGEFYAEFPKVLQLKVMYGK